MEEDGWPWECILKPFIWLGNASFRLVICPPVDMCKCCLFSEAVNMKRTKRGNQARTCRLKMASIWRWSLGICDEMTSGDWGRWGSKVGVLDYTHIGSRRSFTAGETWETAFPLLARREGMTSQTLSKQTQDNEMPNDAGETARWWYDVSSTFRPSTPSVPLKPLSPWRQKERVYEWKRKNLQEKQQGPLIKSD